VKKHLGENKGDIEAAKTMIYKQTQQILKLLEVQVKYGVNVVDPEDEICDFDLDECVKIQSKLEGTASRMEMQMEQIPRCVKMFKNKFEVVERGQVEKTKQTIQDLKHKNLKLQKQFNVWNRNQKYQFAGFKAIQAMNPYLPCKDSQILKNLNHLQLTPNHPSLHIESTISKIKSIKSLVDAVNSIPKSRAHSLYLQARSKQAITKLTGSKSAGDLPPCALIPEAQLGRDMVEPYSKVTPMKIMKINERTRELKEQLFAKDKVIQEKMQHSHAL
jgi:hypothetical protein